MKTLEISHTKMRGRRPRRFIVSWRVCVNFLCLALRCYAGSPEQDAAATVVVFNERDVASIELAGYYAEKRGIPFNHMIGLSCPVEESISREEYDQTIAEPLRKAFISRGWWKTEANLVKGRVADSTIRFVALMRGIPLKVRAVATYEGDKPWTHSPALNHNEAAVDSELAVLGMSGRQISGPSENPYFRKNVRLEDAKTPWLLLVCRLDAAEPATVRRMIDDSIATEKTGLHGFAYVDSRGINGRAGYGEGDEWIRSVATDAASHGIPCVHDIGPAQFPEHYPMTRAALYFGWYSGEVEGPFKDETLRLVPGAVAVHLHSFSADSLRKPLRGWCSPLLERGAAATLGNVFEPYLMLTTHLNYFEERLRSGATFAEASYSAQPGLSWMATFIGDPLYRPFRAPSDADAAPKGDAIEYVAYQAGAVRWFEKNHAAGEALLNTRGKALKSGVIFEGLGLLQAGAKDSAGALASWSRARKFYPQDADRIRCALHAIGLLRETGKPDKALALTRQQIKQYPAAPATARLRVIELELAPPPSPSQAPTPKG